MDSTDLPIRFVYITEGEWNKMAGQKILVVDDEARMRKLVTDFLTKTVLKYLKPATVKQQWICFTAVKILPL